MAVLGAALLLLISSCSNGGSTVETGSDEGSESTSAEAAPSDLVKPEPGPSDLVVCVGTELPLGALQNLEPLASLPEIEAAVIPFLESGEGQFWPQEGWQVATISETAVFVMLLQTEAQTLQDVEERGVDVMFDPGFGDGVDDSLMFAAHDVELVDGVWEWAGSVAGDDCELETVVPDGFHRVEWILDPDAAAPTAESMNVQLLATERECASGQPMGDRLQAPFVIETAEAVLISMVAEPPSGDAFDCQGNPSQMVVVDLPSPLGDRELLEGSTTAGRISDYVGEAFGIAK